MSTRCLRLAWSAFALLLILPQLVAAQSSFWKVTDTVTGKVVYPDGTVSIIENIAYPSVAQRKYQISNISGVSLSIGPCSIISDDGSFSLVPGFETSGTVLAYTSTVLAVDEVAKNIGTHNATVTCNTGVGIITIYIRGTVLYPDPHIVLETPKGMNIPNNSTFNFGSTQTGTPLDVDFHLINMGIKTLNIGGSLTGSAYSVVVSPLLSIPAGSDTTFRLRLLSASAGTFTGQFVITSNDPTQSPYTVYLTGTVPVPPAPQIQITDNGNGGALVTKGSTVNFGNIPVNTTVTRYFNLKNTGTATLNISNFSVTNVSGTRFSAGNLQTNTLSPGSNTIFTIIFQGAPSGSYSGTASLASNDPNSPFSFNLSATVPVVVNTPIVTLTASDPEASETSPNGGQFTLTRSGSTSLPLTVYLTLSGTATNGVDYSAISTTQTFAAGQSTLTIPVTPIDDTAIEDVETVTLALASNAAYLNGSPSSGTVSILNNDFIPCTPSATVLCLQGGRFEASLTAVANGANYTGQTLSLGDASGGFWLFSPANIEIGVKVLDGSAVNGKFWIYYGAATDVSYTLTVRDRANASRTRIFNSGSPFCGNADTGFFTKSRVRSQSAALEFDDDLVRAPGSQQLTASTCVADSTTVCMLGNRFQVRVKRGTVYQQVIPVTSQTAFFSFFSPDNLEIFVKILDGTGLNGKYWVYFGSMTDQSYTVEVTDTMTGVVKNYPSGQAFCGNADTSAF
jgi:hypothetical protein